MRLIGFCGYARSGKDTAALALIERGWRRDAFADALKRDAASALMNSLSMGGGSADDFPWGTMFTDPALKEIFRPFLVEYGRAMRHIRSDYWVTRLFRGLDPRESHVVTDVRYMNEVEAIRQRGGKVIMVTRPGVGPCNEEERLSFLHVKPDCVIMNGGSLEDLHAAVVTKVTEWEK